MAMVSTDQWIQNGCCSVMAFKYHDGNYQRSDPIKITLLPQPDLKIIFHRGEFHSTPHGSWCLDPNGKLSLKYKDEVQTEIFQTFLRLGGTDNFQCIESSCGPLPGMATLEPWPWGEEDVEEPGSQSSLQCQALVPTSHGEDRCHVGYRDCVVVDPGPPQPDDVEVMVAFVDRFVASFPEGSSERTFVFGCPAASELCLRVALSNDTEMDTPRKCRVWDLIQDCRGHRS